MDVDVIRGYEQETVVVVPTYEEALTVRGLVEALLDRHADMDVLVVDDGSPDGTADVVRGLPGFGDRVFLLSRTVKSGLGSAYRASFRWAGERGYRRVLQMDADMSHPVERVGALLAVLEGGADLAIGSRPSVQVGWALFCGVAGGSAVLGAPEPVPQGNPLGTTPNANPVGGPTRRDPAANPTAVAPQAVARPARACRRISRGGALLGPGRPDPASAW